MSQEQEYRLSNRIQEEEERLVNMSQKQEDLGDLLPPALHQHGVHLDHLGDSSLGQCCLNPPLESSQPLEWSRIIHQF